MGKADAFDQAFKTLYEKLGVKKYEPKYGSKRPRMSKKFRRELNRIIGAHDWASADKWRREIIEEARRLRRILQAIPVKHQDVSMGVAQ
jgi:hypothetical protein